VLRLPLLCRLSGASLAFLQNHRESQGMALAVGGAVAVRVRVKVRTRNRLGFQSSKTRMLKVLMGLRTFSRVCRLLLSLLLVG